MQLFKKNLALIILLCSLATHFIFFGYPKKTVFDEVHFGKFISGYFTHEYFFDIHPPLGKLLISGMGYIGGFRPGFSFTQIDQQFPDNKYLWLRLLPTIAGSLLPLVVFFLIQELGMSRSAAFAGGMFMILESSFLVQSRFILLDAFLLLFGFSSLLFYFMYRSRHRLGYFIIALLAGSLAVSVKWTGLTFLGIIGLLHIADLYRSFSKKNLVLLVSIIVFAPLIYISSFVIHLKLLTKSGPGDAFMTPAFQKTLSGNRLADDPNIKPLSLAKKIVELNVEMYRANATLTAGHPYGSKWYTWPFMMRPIYYWYEATSNAPNGTASRIYLIGNPVIWWLSTIAILYLIIDSIPRFHDLNKLRQFVKPRIVQLFLVAAFAINMLPFIGITRVMFLYHYMIAFVFAIIALVYLIDQLQYKQRIFTTIVILALFMFLFFSPLIYGLPLSQHAYNLHIWFPSWQ